MPINKVKDRQGRARFEFEFSRRIHGARLRVRKLLPPAWTRAQADAFEPMLDFVFAQRPFLPYPILHAAKADALRNAPEREDAYFAVPKVAKSKGNCFGHLLGLECQYKQNRLGQTQYFSQFH